VAMIGGEGEPAGAGDLQKPIVRRNCGKGGKRNQKRGPDKKAEMP